ncbi:MAG: zinc ribbon domain-containing protein [Candidatus Helarchaeota archaeon]
MVSIDKNKLIKIGILKRQLDIQEKKGMEVTTSSSWHANKSLLKNFAFWKIPNRGIITIDDVKTAIYQLEKAELIEIINQEKLRLTPKGVQVAKELRTFTPESIPENLFESRPDYQICSSCGKRIDGNSLYCEFCGVRTKRIDLFCSYCGTSFPPNSEFCPRCGQKI